MTRDTDAVGPDPDALEDSIARAAETVGSVWPLHSFVTANPLAGFEDRPFHEAVDAARNRFGGRGYPDPSVLRRAWETGRIDPDVLEAELRDNGIDRDPEVLLDELAAEDRGRDAETDPATEAVDRVLAKWLAAFLDQGEAGWSMPNREEGFYAAWRTLAPHDDEVPGCDRAADLPDGPTAAIEQALSAVPRGEWEAVFEAHLAALPGWTGLVKRRADADGDAWQSAAPISLADYLAVRLTLADRLGAPIVPETDARDGDEAGSGPADAPLPAVWLRAWERSYRDRLLEDLTAGADPDRVDGTGDGSTAAADSDARSGDRPAAQLVFCIDTRSEIVRRHVEAAGPYETHGYAGFFGVPMRFRGYDAEVDVDACPPVVDAQHRVAERADPDRDAEAGLHDRWTTAVDAWRKHLKTLKRNVAAAFTFVEGAGSAYGAAMAARTLVPGAVHDLASAAEERVPGTDAFCSFTLDRTADDERGARDGLPEGMTLSEKVEYAATAFELTGWEEFARLVVFTGHASHTTNNPFDSSLDCGACAGNAGGPNARVLASICNDEAVRDALRDRGVEIPSDTVFLAAEHTTTTDEITLFDGAVPESHRAELERLRSDLETARADAAAERAASLPGGDPSDAVRETERRAADWAETRPEWGLAGNASLVVGPRSLTEGVDLGGRAFLHSYDWTTDPDGDALEAIVTGPLVVTQWINNQYYFATVDNGVYGSGSKVTQNAVGNVGVLQGPGGDLMTGLPEQSLMAAADRPYHQPLRLTAVIHAPVDRVTDVLRHNEDVTRLLDNGWISLSVVDPEQDGARFHYAGELEWESARGRPLVH